MAGGRRFSALLGTVHWTQRYDPLIVFRSPLEESPSETKAACSGGRAAALPPAFLPPCALAGLTPRGTHVLFAGDRLTHTRPAPDGSGSPSSSPGIPTPFQEEHY